MFKRKSGSKKDPFARYRPSGILAPFKKKGVLSQIHKEETTKFGYLVPVGRKAAWRLLALYALLLLIPYAWAWIDPYSVPALARFRLQ